MKYLKLYEQFRLFEADELNKHIIPYPSEQKLDKDKSVILAPGGHAGNPENDYSKIAPSLIDSYNVTHFLGQII